MRMCQPHWDALRNGVERRGLARFIGSADAAMRQTVGEMPPGPYDPLIAAHNMIWGRAMEIGGLEVMMDNDDGSERCPLCHAVLNGADEANWTEGPLDAILQEFEANGWVSAAAKEDPDA